MHGIVQNYNLIDEGHVRGYSLEKLSEVKICNSASFVGSGSWCTWRRWRQWCWRCRWRSRRDWTSVSSSVQSKSIYDENKRGNSLMLHGTSSRVGALQSGLKFGLTAARVHIRKTKHFTLLHLVVKPWGCIKYGMYGLDGEISSPGWGGLDFGQVVVFLFVRPKMSQLEACVIFIIKKFVLGCKSYDDDESC